jgi:hypothetical protein
MKDTPAGARILKENISIVSSVLTPRRPGYTLLRNRSDCDTGMRSLAEDYKYDVSESNWNKVKIRSGAWGLQGINWKVGAPCLEFFAYN